MQTDVYSLRHENGKWTRFSATKHQTSGYFHFDPPISVHARSREISSTVIGIPQARQAFLIQISLHHFILFSAGRNFPLRSLIRMNQGNKLIRTDLETGLFDVFEGLPFTERAATLPDL